MPPSALEKPAYLNFDSFEDVAKNTLFLPIKLPQLGVSELTDGNVLYLRAVSAVFAAIAAVLLYLVLKHWHTRRVAGMTTFMFISSAWVLHHARFTNNEVLYLLAIPALILTATWLASKDHDRKLPLSLFLLAGLLYIPGMWLFMVVSAVIFRRLIKRSWAQLGWRIKSAGLFVFLLTIAPLVYSLATSKDHALQWLAIGQNGTLTLSRLVSNFLDIPKQLFVSGPAEPMFWLVNTPILDVFTVCMFVLGVYSYRIGFYPAREKIILIYAAVSVVLITLGGTVFIAALLPLIYLIAANGIAYMLQSWFVVFPRNPVARSFGIGLVIAAIAVSSFYHMQKYFVAWPNTPVTKEIFRQ